MEEQQKQHPRILFWFGLFGIAFYMLGPIVFPDAPLRQPELLPVFTLMVGLGQLLKESKKKLIEGEDADANNNNSIGSK